MTHPTETDREQPMALELADKLAARRVTNWFHATGDTPKSNGFCPDRECAEAAYLLRTQHAELEALRKEFELLKRENANLRSVMIAAAEEIHEHWDAHCDADGYGPANLMRRLEAGIPSEYAYKAGDFARMRAEVERLRTALMHIEGAAMDINCERTAIRDAAKAARGAKG